MKKGDSIPTGWHPERMEDEIYLGNFSEKYFPNLGWETKRFGEVAYSAKREPLKKNPRKLRPVFVKKSEVIETGFVVTESEDIFS